MLQRALRIARAAGEGALDLLFMRVCLACQTELPEGHCGAALCENCLDEIPPVDWPVCRRCAAEVPMFPGGVPTCSRCESDKLRFDATFSLGHYEGLLKELILRMKADRHEQIGQVIAELICNRYRKELRQLQVDAVVPIPMTPLSFLRRRTNPPAVIARRIGRELCIPMMGRLLQRSPNLSPQHVLSRAGRFRNVKGGYRVRKGFHLDGPHIMLIDDVMTTGATCSEVARILKREGASRVTVVIAARTHNN